MDGKCMICACLVVFFSFIRTAVGLLVVQNNYRDVGRCFGLGGDIFTLLYVGPPPDVSINTLYME